MVIQFKRILDHTGDIKEAINNINENLENPLQPGELLLCSYVDEDGANKYLFAVGINEGMVRILPTFLNEDEIVSYIKSFVKTSTDEAISDLTSEMSAKSDDNKVTAEIQITNGVLSKFVVNSDDIASQEAFNELKERVNAFFMDADIDDIANEYKDTLKELQAYITTDVSAAADITRSINNNKNKIQTIANSTVNGHTIGVVLSDEISGNSIVLNGSEIKLDGYSKGTISPLTAVDTINSALGKLEARVDAGEADLSNCVTRDDVVDFARDLTGRIEATPEEFTFRPSAGEKSIREESAVMRKIKGNSLVWNQKIRNTIDTVSGSAIGWHVRQGADNAEIIGESIRFNFVSGVSVNALISQEINFVKGHKYSITMKWLLNGELDEYNRAFRIRTSNDIYCSQAVDFISNVLATPTLSGVVSVFFTPTNNAKYITIDPRKFSNDIGQYAEICVKITDVTQMFGEGNEPTTIEEYYERMPAGIDTNAYNDGRLIFVNTKSIETVGFNQWDEEWEEGTFNSESGDKLDDPTYADGKIRSTNYIEVLPNTQYYCGKSGFMYWEYDNEYNYIPTGTSSGLTPMNGLFTTSSNCRYIRFRVTDTTYHNDICINLSHTGVRNGEYEPYWKHIHYIPEISKYFPDGLKSAGAVFDEINETQAIKRICVINLERLNWQYNSSANIYCAPCTGIKRVETFPYGNNVNAINTGGYTNSLYGSSSTNDDKLIFVNYRSESVNTICIRDTSYSNAADFKAAMRGVKLYCEIAEPEVIDLTEPIQLYYRVEDFGTEKAISSLPSAPFKADIVYQFNAEGRIRDNSRNIEKLTKITSNKVDKVNGKGLSTNDFTNAYIEKIDGKAEKKGTYPGLSVGFAENIVGDNSSTEEMFYFRPTASEYRNVRDGAARITSIKGNTVVWNQIMNYYSDGGLRDSGVQIERYQKNIRISGTLSSTTSMSLEVGEFNLQGGHLYIIGISEPLPPGFLFYPRGALSVIDPYIGTGRLINLVSSRENNTSIVSVKGQPIQQFIGAQYDYRGKFFVVDLTWLFGSGKEPLTVKEFFKRIPLGKSLKVSAATGELLDGCYNAIRTTSFNQFDNGIAKVCAGIPYRITGDVDYLYFRSDGGDITRITLGDDGKYIPPLNGSLTAGGTNVCVHLCWSEYSHLEDMYAPYKSAELDLSWIRKYFPRGMRSAGNVRDEISYNPVSKKWEAITRVSNIRVGNMSWDGGLNNTFTTTLLASNIKPSDSLETPGDITSTLYNVSYSDATKSIYDNVIGVSPDGKLIVRCSLYSDPRSFATGMSNTLINYALAKPIVTEIVEDISLDYDCSDYGTEELIPIVDSAPLVADIAYEPNVLAQIKNMPDLLRRLEALEIATQQINEVSQEPVSVDV